MPSLKMVRRIILLAVAILLTAAILGDYIAIQLASMSGVIK